MCRLSFGGYIYYGVTAKSKYRGLEGVGMGRGGVSWYFRIPGCLHTDCTLLQVVFFGNNEIVRLQTFSHLTSKGLKVLVLGKWTGEPWGGGDWRG